MRVARIALLTGLITTSVFAAEPLRAVHDEAHPDQVVIFVGDQIFTTYAVAEDQKYPYFYPVNGPISGNSVTTESSEPYPHHHSLFFGCDKVNGGNYWQEGIDRGQIQSQDLRVVQDAGEEVIFENSCLWRIPGNDPVMKDHRRVRVTAPDKQTRIIDFAITLTPLENIRIKKTNHSLFSARMVPELSVEEGGELTNSNGESGEADTFGKRAPWMDYSGTRDGVTEGLAILQHPQNPWYPAPWFTRNYGFFSPTPMYWPENDRDTELERGEEATLRYRVIVHAGDATAAGIADHFEALASEGKSASAE
jgi:hypothetical protein